MGSRRSSSLRSFLAADERLTDRDPIVSLDWLASGDKPPDHGRRVVHSTDLAQQLPPRAFSYVG